MTARRAGSALALLAMIAPAHADQAPSDAPNRAETVAALLAAADGATTLAAGKRRRALGHTLDALDRLGAYALATEDDPVPQWRIAAGASTNPPLRGRVLGPAFRRGWMAPGAEYTVDQLFMGGQSATVAVAAAPNEPMHLSVVGPDDARACADPQHNCRWMPLFTQRYTITVRNAGSQPARVYLVFD